MSFFIEKDIINETKGTLVSPLSIGMATRFARENNVLKKELVSDGAPVCVSKIFELTKHKALKDTEKLKFLRLSHSPLLIL